MKFLTTAVLPILCLLMSVATMSAAELAAGRFLVDCERPDVFVPYASSQPIDQHSTKIDRIIVGIHASGYDAIKCLSSLSHAASKIRGARETTLIVTPQFFSVDAIQQRIPNGMLAWRVSPYRGSSLASIGPENEKFTFSAYHVMNQLLSHVANLERFPNLKHVVICGHSAGGQMAQRYAITSLFRAPKGVSVRFVASGASSYAYLDAKRPRQSGSKVLFEKLPDELRAKYPKYNDWGFGLDERYQAFRRAQTDYLRNRYAKRRVLYLCGSEDNDPNDSTLSKTPGAMLQGRNRLERMRFFALHLVDVYGQDIEATHAFGIARGVKHNGFDAYASTEGLKFLFDYSREDSNGDGKTDWEEWIAGSR